MRAGLMRAGESMHAPARPFFFSTRRAPPAPRACSQPRPPLITRPPPLPPPSPSLPQIPDDILHDPALAAACAALPPNYAFEVPKTVWRLRTWGSTRPALQFPEGLLLFATTLADIVAAFVPGAAPLILGDVAYGACCVDDRAASAAGADALIHYGHSCLIPAPSCALPVLYVFVDIAADADHLVRSVVGAFGEGVPRVGGGGKEGRAGEEGGGEKGGPAGSTALAPALPPPPPPATPPPPARARPHLALAGTIQFGSTVAAAAAGLRAAGFPVTVPQARPLSPGEVLGCTAPRLGRAPTSPPPASKASPAAPSEASEGGGAPSEAGPTASEAPEAIVFVADGRFHMEALMLANPSLPAFRYDPYARALSEEVYDHAGMRRARAGAVRAARATLPARGGGGGGAAPPVAWGLALSTLGRQASSTGLVARLRRAMAARGVEAVTVLLSEVTPDKLRALSGGGGGRGRASKQQPGDAAAAQSAGPGVAAWVQVACPRLSIDWGAGFSQPTLTPYEALVALGVAPWWEGSGERGGGEEGKGGGCGAGGCGGGGGGGGGGGCGRAGDAEAAAGAAPGLIPYPMDFYSAEGGEWGAWHGLKREG